MSANKFVLQAPYIFYDDNLQNDGAIVVSDSLISDFIRGPIDKIHWISKGFDVMERPFHFVIPGLVNTHAHSPMTLLRGMADDLPLKVWLENHIWPMEAQFVNEEFCRIGAKLASAEALLSGVTTISDMYFFAPAIAKSFLESGLRATVGISILDFPTPESRSSIEQLELARVQIDQALRHPQSRINWSIAPHAPYTVSPRSMEMCRDLAKEFDLTIQCHASETLTECEEIQKKYGCSPIEYLDGLGMLSEKTLLAHCVHLSEREIDILAQRQVGVSHCLSSNLKLGSGIAPIQSLLKSGVNMSLGTDGAASNNRTDLFTEMHLVAKVHKGVSRDPTLLDARTVFDMATKGGAKVCGHRDIGTLAKGKKADIVAVDFRHARTWPVYDPISHLVYVSQSSDVKDVWVDGVHLVQKGSLTKIDMDDLLKEVESFVTRLKEARK